MGPEHLGGAEREAIVVEGLMLHGASTEAPLVRVLGVANQTLDDGRVEILLSEAEALWLQAVALPSALAALRRRVRKVPSDATATMDGADDADDGQIPGQLAIE